jgi:hypothetical protein
MLLPLIRGAASALLAIVDVSFAKNVRRLRSHFPDHAFANPEYLSGGLAERGRPEGGSFEHWRDLWTSILNHVSDSTRSALKTQEPHDAETGDGCYWGVTTQPDASCNAPLFRSLVKMAFTVPKGMVVCFAILLAPKSFSRFSVRTWRIVTSGSGGLPSRLPFGHEVFSPIIVRSQAGLGDATAGGVFGLLGFFSRIVSRINIDHVEWPCVGKLEDGLLVGCPYPVRMIGWHC